MENPQKDLTIPTWFKTLRSMFVEKVAIICADRDKRTELISKSRHRNKVLVTNVKKYLSWYDFYLSAPILYKNTKQN